MTRSNIMPHNLSGGTEEAVCPRTFVEKYSLPRVARLVADGGRSDAAPGADLLLYAHYTSGKVGARNSSLLVIPDTYPGWFSVVTERGQVKARCYTTVQRLVQASVSSFLTVSDIPAYVLANRTNTDGRRQQYNKTTVRSGQVLRLLAVYEDLGSESKNKRLSWPLLARADRYTQCLTPTDQVVYIPVSTPGQFYCVSGGSPEDTTGKVYQLSKLLRTFPLPVRVAIINGFKTQGSLLLESYRREEVILGCVLPKDSGQFRLMEIDMNSKLYVVRPSSRLSEERRLYQSEKVQAALRFCHENWQQWTRQLKVIHHIFPREGIGGGGGKGESRGPTERSASFRFATPRQRPLPPPPLPPPDPAPPSASPRTPAPRTAPAPAPRSLPPTHRPAPSFKTRILISDTASEISSEIVDCFFAETNYPARQEKRKPTYRTRVTIGEPPYATVRDSLPPAPALYAEIPDYFCRAPASTVSVDSVSTAASTLS